MTIRADIPRMLVISREKAIRRRRLDVIRGRWGFTCWDAAPSDALREAFAFLRGRAGVQGDLRG